MKKPVDTKEKKASTFRQWFDVNKDDYNRRRRERYANDAEYRARVQKTARDSKRGILAKKHGSVYRYWHGVKILVHRVGTICTELSIDPQYIRGLEKDGVIPKPIFHGTQRVYTQNQYDLIRGVVEELRDMSSYHEMQAIKMKHKLRIKFNWEKI